MLTRDCVGLSQMGEGLAFGFVFLHGRGGHIGNSTPILSTGCERLGVFNFSPTSGLAGTPRPAPKRIC